MVDAEARTRRGAHEENAAITRAAEPAPQTAPRRRLRLFSLL
jgi:hypothetical protein